MQHPVLGIEENAHLRITQHPVGMNLWPVPDLEPVPRVCLQLFLSHTPVKELLHLFEDTRLGLGR